MTVATDSNKLSFEGVLDERCVLDDLVNAFSNVKNSGDGKPLILDLSAVKRANSSGIITWLKFLQKAGVKMCYINSPVWLVNQFNMIDQFFENGSKVESIQAPFYCEDTGESLNINLNIGAEIPIKDSYEDFSLDNRIIDGQEYEPDFEPERYFSFLSSIQSNYA